MINLAIIGAAGYTGQELLELIIDRNDINIVAITSDRLEGVALATVSERFATKKPLVFESNDHPRIAKLVDAVFLCLPHGISMDVAKIYLDNNCKILDLSADFRLKDKDIFEKWYLKKHSSYDLLAQSVYGLPELYKGKIGNADLIALPGCYPTASILSLAPIIQTGYIDLSSIVINAVSGVSGAGKKSSVEFSLGELYGEYFGYGDLIHRHTPEIEQELSLL
ncbi:MAG: N-acetyl-gamma-glutamyl-phosphate reductase, partial [Nitrospinota bacterium]